MQTCDMCNSEVTYADEVLVVTERPSDRTELVSIVGGCADCFTPSTYEQVLESFANGGTAASTRKVLDQYIHSHEAHARGHLFLTI